MICKKSREKVRKRMRFCGKIMNSSLIKSSKKRAVPKNYSFNYVNYLDLAASLKNVIDV